jgi:hypothetical protein
VYGVWHSNWVRLSRITAAAKLLCVTSPLYPWTSFVFDWLELQLQIWDFRILTSVFVFWEKCINKIPGFFTSTSFSTRYSPITLTVCNKWPFNLKQRRRINNIITLPDATKFATRYLLIGPWRQFIPSAVTFINFAYFCTLCYSYVSGISTILPDSIN